MQKDSTRFSPDEQLVVRRWRLGVLAFYGLIVAGLWLFLMIGSRSMQIACSMQTIGHPETTGSSESAVVCDRRIGRVTRDGVAQGEQSRPPAPSNSAVAGGGRG
jgi:hypothetical protein